MKGSIEKRGKSWSVTIDLPRDPATGKRRRKRITASTKRELDSLQAQYIAQIESGGFAEADAKRLTVAKYMERWLDSIAPNVRPSTLVRYRGLASKHIIPIIGRVQIAKLTPLDVQRFYANRLEAGLSGTSVDLLHNVLHRALKQAVRWGLLTRNVTEAVDAPRRNTPEYITWSEEQAGSFLDVTDQDELAALWRLALLTGMRRGEILGLKWEDLDLQRKTLSVRRTLSRGSGAKLEYGEPKTTHGKRSIALPVSVVDSLRVHLKQQNDTVETIGKAYHDDGLVFCNAQGEPLHPNSLQYRFERLMAKAVLPKIRFHDLRHTHATLMLANGEHPKIVQERLGHSDISMTLNRYSHVTMDMQRSAADRIDSLLAQHKVAK